MFTQFEEVNLISETRDNAEIGDKYDDDSIIQPLFSEEEIDAIYSEYEYEDETISAEMLEDICYGSKSH